MTSVHEYRSPIYTFRALCRTIANHADIVGTRQNTINNEDLNGKHF